MISDTERREVARRIREIELSKGGYVAWWKIAKALKLKQLDGWFGWEKFEPDSAKRLADLIEPPTQCPYYHSDRHRCSAYDDVVDRDALLAVADELSEVRCDKRGELSITYGDLQGLARIIREALGVDDG